MRIAVFGATGSTGRQVVEQALSVGHKVIAVARRPEQVAPHLNLTACAGDVFDAASLRASCRDADAVISCIGPRNNPNASAIMNNLRPGTTMSVATKHMVAAAQAAGVRRFVFQSGIGLSDGSELSGTDAGFSAYFAAPCSRQQFETRLRASVFCAPAHSTGSLCGLSVCKTYLLRLHTLLVRAHVWLCFLHFHLRTVPLVCCAPSASLRGHASSLMSGTNEHL